MGALKATHGFRKVLLERGRFMYLYVSGFILTWYILLYIIICMLRNVKCKMSWQDSRDSHSQVATHPIPPNHTKTVSRVMHPSDLGTPSSSGWGRSRLRATHAICFGTSRMVGETPRLTNPPESMAGPLARPRSPRGGLSDARRNILFTVVVWHGCASARFVS